MEQDISKESKARQSTGLLLGEAVMFELLLIFSRSHILWDDWSFHIRKDCAARRRTILCPPRSSTSDSKDAASVCHGFLNVVGISAPLQNLCLRHVKTPSTFNVTDC